MIDFLKRIWSGFKRIVTSTISVFVEYTKDVVVNAPAVAIMATSAMGITGIATSMGAESMFVPVSFLNPTITVYFLSVSTVLILATIAGKTAEVRT